MMSKCFQRQILRMVSCKYSWMKSLASSLRFRPLGADTGTSGCPLEFPQQPGYFQRKLAQNLEGLNGAYKIAYDILITGRGSTLKEAVKDHDATLLQLLDRCRERNLKLNREKLQLKRSETPFIGHVLTPKGVKPDPSKVEAILTMERPKDAAAVRRLAGLVNYLSKFLSKLSELCEPLGRLTHKDVEWRWSEEQEEPFERVKHVVTSTPVLRYFNSSLRVEGQRDASSSGYAKNRFHVMRPPTAIRNNIKGAVAVFVCDSVIHV